VCICLLRASHLNAWQTNLEELGVVLVLLLEHLLPQPANSCCLRHVANGCCFNHCCFDEPVVPGHLVLQVPSRTV
jgi:hypothetical protein